MMMLRRSAGIWGPVAFCGAALLAARGQNGYSHRSHHISGLAARGERSAKIMIPGFLLLSTSSMLMPAPTPTLVRMARIAGATTIAAGLIQPSDRRCPQPGSDADATAADVGHGLASVATFLLWTAMPIVAFRQSGPRWYRFVSGAFGITSAVGFVAAGATTRTESPSKGVAQRAFLGSVFLWHFATAIRSIVRS